MNLLSLYLQSQPFPLFYPILHCHLAENAMNLYIRLMLKDHKVFTSFIPFTTNQILYVT